MRSFKSHPRRLSRGLDIYGPEKERGRGQKRGERTSSEERGPLFLSSFAFLPQLTYILPLFPSALLL